MNYICFCGLVVSICCFCFAQSKEEECVYLEKCDSVFWMMKNIKKIPDTSPREVDELIKSYSAGCDLGKVTCPKEEIEEDDEEFTGESNDSNSNITSRATFVHPGIMYNCNGSMSILVLQYDSDLKMKPYRIKKSIQNVNKVFKSSDENQIVRAQVDGQCCWETYSQPSFRGSKKLFNMGDDKQPDGDIASIKKIVCSK